MPTWKNPAISSSSGTLKNSTEASSVSLRVCAVVGMTRRALLWCLTAGLFVRRRVGLYLVPVDPKEKRYPPSFSEYKFARGTKTMEQMRDL